MTLNGVMAVALRYFNEFGKLALQKTICEGIFASVYCIFSACTMASQRKFTFAISSPDEFIVQSVDGVFIMQYSFYYAILLCNYAIILYDPSMDHSRARRASVAPLPRDWKRRAGRPRHTWLRTVESDLAPLNIGLATACHRARNRQAWSKLVGKAVSSHLSGDSFIRRFTCPGVRG